MKLYKSKTCIGWKTTTTRRSTGVYRTPKTSNMSNIKFYIIKTAKIRLHFPFRLRFGSVPKCSKLVSHKAIAFYRIIYLQFQRNSISMVSFSFYWIHSHHVSANGVCIVFFCFVFDYLSQSIWFWFQKYILTELTKEMLYYIRT